MNLDQTFFVTIAALKIAQMDEAKLALLISHELSHYLMDHQVQRMGLGFIRDKINMKLGQGKAQLDPTKKEFMAKTKLQSYSCFYPQQKVVDKFMERNCDALAVMLWKKAYPDVDHEVLMD